MIGSAVKNYVKNRPDTHGLGWPGMMPSAMSATVAKRSRSGRRSMQMADDSKIAAIDVGSNGIRLAIGRVRDASSIEMAHYERAAVRMGTDAFGKGRLSDETMDQVVKTMRSFRETMDKHDVRLHRAVATSAARESDNSDDLIAAIQRATGIELEIIGGLEEAQLMFFAIAPRHDLVKKSALLIDMGGGSVELTVAWDRRPVGAASVPLGPVRLLQKLEQHQWPEFRAPTILERHAFAVDSFVDTELSEHSPPAVAFGAGGNIEALAELRVPLLGKSKTHKIKIGDLESMIPTLLSMSIKQRIKELKLRPDRADVIAVAAMVLHMMMDETDVTRLMVPGLGIKDGILNQLALRLASERAPST